MRRLSLSCGSRPRGVVLAIRGFAAGALMSVGASLPADAGHAPPGASSCSGCHAANAEIPPIDGRSATEIVAAMADYRSGARPATVMNRIAKGFSEAETQAIADWLAGRKPAKP